MLWGKWCDNNGLIYLDKILKMLEKYLSIPYDVICFTDRKTHRLPFKDKVNYIKIPGFVLEWKRNFPKIYMHCSDNGLEEGARILYLDLDSIIINDFDGMASYDGDFCGIKTYKSQEFGYISGGLLSFEFGTTSYIWKALYDNYKKWDLKCRGHERIFYKYVVPKCDFWNDLYVNEFVDYKRNLKVNKNLLTLPEDAVFIHFHGIPRIHTIKNDEFINQYWKNL